MIRPAAVLLTLALASTAVGGVRGVESEIRAQRSGPEQWQADTMAAGPKKAALEAKADADFAAGYDTGNNILDAGLFVGGLFTAMVSGGVILSDPLQ